MTARTDATSTRIVRATDHLRFGLAELAEVERDAPAEVASVVAIIVAHLRSWHPEAVSPLGALGPPTEAIRDPRGEAGPR